MQRKRAIAIAIEQQQTLKVRLIVASGLLLQRSTPPPSYQPLITDSSVSERVVRG